jgi:hypothetical protein
MMRVMLDSGLYVTQVGMQAHRILAGDQIGSVFGVVRRGTYLHFESGWVVFLSFGLFHGPLTLNLGGDIEPIQALQPGVKVRVHAGAIGFSEPDFEIVTRGTPVWAAPAPSRSPVSRVERAENLASIARSRLAGPRSVESGPLLPALFEPVSPEAEPGGLASQHPDLAGVREALRGGQANRIASALEPFLGWGIGLTPSGDDLAIGFILALNRWGDTLRPGLDVAALNQALISAALEKTTALSASMIRCASIGQADERLIRPLDGILTGDPDPEACAAYLDQWGHSSGSDVLAGMALAIIQ